MIGNYKYYFQFFLINLGIKLLPKDIVSKKFINNCMDSKMIKISEEKES